MASKKSKGGYGFGTAPVFLAGISTILGAILFLRFGYAVAHTGVLGSILLILIGHLITIPTALAIAEIATNLKVEGGGEYFMISRSFGPMVGGTIGISLYLSQAISVAFYIIAFSEAFTPLFSWIQSTTGIEPRIWMIGVPAAAILVTIMLTKGADMGVSTLWIVASILGVSLIMFFLGNPPSAESVPFQLFSKVENPDSFFIVFAIIFPAFTGMTAGVGLSGDLKNPRKSIPRGVLYATLTGMAVYILVVIKFGISLTPEQLAADQFAMAKIALWKPIVPIGLAAASISSAIGSILIAPRTMQALANDSIFPVESVNQFLARGRKETNEPINATIVTAVVVFVFVSMGSVNLVAKVISMFFMITYGALCLVSFLEHFAGNPSYRPTFRSKWYFSLIGALACFIMMIQMSTLFAILAFLVIGLIYIGLKRTRGSEYGLSSMIKGVLFQLTRQLRILIQRRQQAITRTNWRPSFITISTHSFDRMAPFELLRWFSHHHGFGTFIHYIQGFLNEETQEESKRVLDKLIKMGEYSRAGIYVDTIISPSFKTAIAQIVQIPGVSGMDNNCILFEFHKNDDSELPDIIEGCHFASIVDFNICVLRSSEHHFGYKRCIHIWLTPGDYRNANLMILLSYILMGHPEWEGCEISLFVAFQEKEINKEVKSLGELINKGRIPISQNNVQKIPWNKQQKTYETLICDHSRDADLVIMGFSLDKLTRQKGSFFKRFAGVKDVLFVRAGQKIIISEDG